MTRPIAACGDVLLGQVLCHVLMYCSCVSAVSGRCVAGHVALGRSSTLSVIDVVR